MKSDHRSDREDGLGSPQDGETHTPDSDFEIEDDALLGAQRPTVPLSERARQYSADTGGRVWNRLASTLWGRRLEDYLFGDTKKTPKRAFFLGLIVLVVLAFLFLLMRGNVIRRTLLLPKSSLGGTTSEPGATIFQSKPEGFKIYGLVFYGRRHTVEILDCYLRRNLVKNGGWLDEIHFLINTNVEEDREWIDELLPQVKEYKGIYMKEGTDMRDFESVWRQGLTHNNKDLYVKFDDDLVFMSDTAVEEVVTSLLTHPEAFIVLGNLVNSAALGWLHHRHGAIESYLPEDSEPAGVSDAYGPEAWRASKLPTHPYDSKKEFFADDDWGHDPPYPNHRWLPLRDNQSRLQSTPIWRTEYDANSWDWNHWQLGAQQHYSLLAHLERLDEFKARSTRAHTKRSSSKSPLASTHPANPLSVYHVGDPTTGLWNMRYMHANINLIAIWANDILEHLPFSKAEDDEAHFTITLPETLGRQCYVQTRALAAHFAFGPQGGMYDTDLLARYRAYANTHVCKYLKMHIESREEWPGGG